MLTATEQTGVLRSLLAFRNESKEAWSSEKKADVLDIFAVVTVAGGMAPFSQKALEWICLVSHSGN